MLRWAAAVLCVGCCPLRYRKTCSGVVALEITITIRSVDSSSPKEIGLVAQRMGETLVEVLGRTRGERMYTADWLDQRVRWHLDSTEVLGAVFVAEDSGGAIVGHTIVRLEDDGQGNDIGLFATTYVTPNARKSGVAIALLDHGERWMCGHGMTEAVTYTDADNEKLQKLFEGRGYVMSVMPNDFVKLTKDLVPTAWMDA